MKYSTQIQGSDSKPKLKFCEGISWRIGKADTVENRRSQKENQKDGKWFRINHSQCPKFFSLKAFVY